jgi:signal transduction histidine kinase/putative methionine-R-sulfoxide reductase with GAF domain
MDQIVESSASSPTGTRELLECALAHLDEAILVVSADGNRVWANDEAARLTGYPNAEALLAAPPEEALSRFEVTRADGTPLPPRELPGRRALAGDDPPPTRLRFRTHGGAERVSDVRAVPIRDEDGVLRYVISYFREVTADAERTSALLDSLYRAAPVGLGFWDRELRYVRVNDALAALNERPPADHVGRTLAEVVPQLAHVLEPIARGVLERREPVVALEIAGGTPSDPDRTRYWLASYYPVLAADGEALGVGAVVEEITDRRLAEQRTELQHAVTRILADAESGDAAIPAVLQAICETLGWEVACWWSTDPDAPRRTWAREGAQLDGFLAITERSALTPDLLPGRVASSGRPEWLPDLTPPVLARAPVATAEGLRSGVAFPVVVDGEVVGVLETFTKLRQERDDLLLRALTAIGAQLGQFLRRKRTEEERAQLLHRERVARSEAEAAAATLRKLERVSEVALAHVSLDDLLHALLARIVEVLDADSAAILLLEDDEKLHVRATVGLEREIEHSVAVPFGAGMAGSVAASRAPLLVPDLSQIELVSPVLRERGLNSLVAIPLVVEDRVIGVVHAGSEAYAQFVDEDARLLELIADRIALAINQAALHEAERAAQERLQFLSEASATLASSLDTGATLRRVAQLAVPTFADWCVVDLVAAGGSLERVAVAHADPTVADAARRVAELFPSTLDDAFGIGKVIRERTPSLRRDPEFDALRANFPHAPEYVQLMVDLRLNSLVTVPLIARDQAFGAITFVWSTSGRVYDERDVQFFQELGARAAIAVDNARLYAAAERRRDRLAFLAEATGLLGSSLDVERSLDQLTSLLTESFADWSAIHLVQPEGVRATSVARRDPEKAALARAELASWHERPLPKTVADALESGVSTRWTATAEDHVPGPLGAEERMHSGLVVPLVARTRILGTVSLARGETPEPYDDDDLEFAEDIARRAAVAIDNARLYREAAATRDRLGFLAEASALLAASLDVEEALDRLAHLVAGRVADWCSIHLADDEGPRLVSLAHADPSKEAAARAAVDSLEPDGDAQQHGVGAVIRTGRPELYPTIPEELLAEGPARDAGMHSCVIVPLEAHGRTLGALSLVWAETPARYEERDLEFALDLARRAAIAVDNAQLYRAAEERAQAARVLASVGDGVVFVDRHGYVRTWNRAAATATGIAASDVVDRLAAEAIPGWASIVARVPIVAAGGASPRAESLPLDLGDRELWLSIHGVVVPDGIVYAFRDLTEERALETMRTEFVSTVSHELRTPLAAIYGAAMTLRRSDVALDDDQRARLLDVVSGESDRLARTVNDILWASRLDSGALHVTLQHCNPGALITEVVEAHETHLDDAHEIALELQEGLPPVLGDPDKVGRILINLVDNAVKYSPDGGRVDIDVRQFGSHVRFRVSDRGLGIPPAEQRRVFEKFYRLDPNMTRGVGGTGLGLYICRELVHRMDGRIWVESEGLGRGSTFYVELPVAGDFTAHMGV